MKTTTETHFFAQLYLEDLRGHLLKAKDMAEKALAQVDDATFFRTLDDETNSLAVQVKHIAGNLRSRFTDFLTTDGDKPDRQRDTEFLVEEDSRQSLMEAWETAWSLQLTAVDGLHVSDLDRRITIRGEPHTVLKALQRNLGHLSYHTGQIVQLAKHFQGDRWQTLSIPRGESEAYSAQVRAMFGASE